MSALLTVKQHQARQGHHQHKACGRKNPGGVARIGGRAGQRCRGQLGGGLRHEDPGARHVCCTQDFWTGFSVQDIYSQMFAVFRLILTYFPPVLFNKREQVRKDSRSVTKETLSDVAA